MVLYKDSIDQSLTDDYRRVNMKITLDRYLLPYIHDLTAILRGTVFPKMYLVEACNRILVATGDIH